MQDPASWTAGQPDYRLFAALVLTLPAEALTQLLPVMTCILHECIADPER